MRPCWGDGIEADRRVKVGHRLARGGASKNPLFDIVLREIPAPAPTRTGSFSAAAVATNWLTPNTVLSRSPFDLGLGRAWQAKRVGALVLHLLIRYWRHRRRQGVP